MLHETRFPLTDAGAPPATARPGVYLIFFDGTLPMYRPVSRARFPLYAGSAQDLRERLRRHRRNTACVANLNGGRDLWVLAVALPSRSAAEYAESLAIEVLRPCWNTVLAGFGSRFQGRTRATQAPPPWSILHPGRRVGTGATKLSTALLTRAVARHLDEHTRTGLWAALDGG